jgi:hypothetical protein
MPKTSRKSHKKDYENDWVFVESSSSNPPHHEQYAKAQSFYSQFAFFTRTIQKTTQEAQTASKNEKIETCTTNEQSLLLRKIEVAHQVSDIDKNGYVAKPFNCFLKKNTPIDNDYVKDDFDDLPKAILASNP